LSHRSEHRRSRQTIAATRPVRARRNDDGDGHLAGTQIVRPIKRDGADRIAAKAEFALFVQPLAWPIWVPVGAIIVIGFFSACSTMV
jgi:hypothetical protein